MKIAVDVVPIRTDGTVGGAMNFVIELLKGLGIRKNNEYFLLTAHWNHDYFEYFEQFGIKRICVVSSTISKENKYVCKIKELISKGIRKIFNKNFSMPSFSRILTRNNVDLLFCPMSAPTYSEPGIPTVSIIYDIQHEYYEQFFSPEELQHRRAFYEQICNKTDAVVCISEFTRKTFIDKYNYPLQNAFVVYIGIQDRFEIPSEEKLSNILNKYKINNVKYAYYPGNFWPHKNHKMLLTAFSKYLKNNPNSDLHIVFTGCLLENQPIIQKAIKEMGIEERVHFLGYIDEDEMPCIYQGCQFVVFPSLFEGFGIPVLEGIKMGKPVVCSNVTSLPEIGGDLVTYFDPRRPDEIEKAIVKVTADNELVNELVVKSKEQIKKFTLDNMVDSYLDIFDSVADKKSSKLKYGIEGIYPDKWSQKNICVMLQKNEKKKKASFDFFLCPAVPHKQVKLQFNLDGKVKKYIVKRNSHKNIEIEIYDSQLLNIEISPCFYPRKVNIQDDRELGIIVEKAKIIEEEGNEIELFGE